MREGVGFGLYLKNDQEAGFGDRPDEIYRDPDQAGRRLLQLAAKRKASTAQPSLELKDVRHLVGRTQAELARSLGLDQAGISRLEKRQDWKVSTLQDYIAGVGGVLELRVRFPTFEAPLHGPVKSRRARRGARS
jgi:DNA-binding XRE family transcriptional regulator